MDNVLRDFSEITTRDKIFETIEGRERMKIFFHLHCLYYNIR